MKKACLNIYILLVLAIGFLTVSTVQADEPRVKPVPLAEMNAQQKELLGIVDGEPLPPLAKSNLLTTFVHHPELMAVYLPMAGRVYRAPEFTDKERVLIICRTVWLYQSEYEWAPYYVMALEVGWTREDIERLKIGPDAPGWSRSDWALLKAADQLVKNSFLEDEVWTALREKYSVQDIMTLMTLVTHYHWASMMTNSLKVELETPSQGFRK